MTFISDEAMATSSDELPQGMKFTREPIENPLAITCNKNTLYPETCSMCKFRNQLKDGLCWVCEIKERQKNKPHQYHNFNHGRITEFNEDNHTTRHD